MKHNTRQSRMLGIAALASVALLGACADGMIEGGDDPALSSQTDGLTTDPMWTPCATQGGTCTFSGTRTVRYGRDGRYVTGTFTGSVPCVRSAFPRGYVYRRNNTCEYDANPTAPPSTGGTTDAGTGGSTKPDAGTMPPATDAGTMPMPTDAGTMPMPTPTDAGTSTGMMGPYVNMNAIPKGNPGVSTVQIKPTTEQPGPGDGTGAFRTQCVYSHMAKDDPIVFPGQPGASHLHVFFGNTGTNANSTHDSLRSSGNSTCRGGIANRTAYWVPAVVDGSGTPIAPELMNVYYKTGYGGIAPQDVKPFPQGLRMIAGNAKSSSRQGNAYWDCAENYIGHPGNIPNCGTGNHVIMAVDFPQCWDGKNLDSSDHKSHMAYPVGGACPSTHPVPIPAITIQAWYKQPASGTSSWRLVSDMYDASLPGGYSAHADWMEAWDPAVVQAFVKNCDNAAVDCHSHLLGDGREIYYQQ